MKFYKPLIIYGSLLLALQSSILPAEQVQMFDKPPSAEEMGRILFGQKPQATGAIKMRSISFSKQATEASKSEELVHMAKTELTSIGLPIQFAYNSDEILPDSIPFIEEIGKMLTLQEYADKRLVIEGHTDSAGSDAYNLALSKRRANAVKHYLSSHFGVSTQRLQANGRGESKPLPGYSPEDEANRRVQFYSAN